MNVLDRLDQLEREATPGPWEWHDQDPWTLKSGRLKVLWASYDDSVVEARNEDAVLISLSRAHLRALLDVARAAQNAREIEDYSLSEYAAMVDEHGIGGTPLQRALAPLLEDTE